MKFFISFLFIFVLHGYSTNFVEGSDLVEERPLKTYENDNMNRMRRFINMFEEFDMRAEDQRTDQGGNVKNGQSVYGSLLCPQALNNVKLGKRRRRDLEDIDMRDQSISGGGNVQDGQSLFLGIICPQLLNNIKAGKRRRRFAEKYFEESSDENIFRNRRKRFVNFDDYYDFDMRQTTNGGGNVNGGSRITVKIGQPQVGHNVETGKK